MKTFPMRRVVGLVLLLGCAKVQVTKVYPGRTGTPNVDLAALPTDLGSGSAVDLAHPVAADLASASVPDLSSSAPPDLTSACVPTGGDCTFATHGDCCSHFCFVATGTCK
jgi:hypothetical protein